MPVHGCISHWSYIPESFVINGPAKGAEALVICPRQDGRHCIRSGKPGLNCGGVQIEGCRHLARPPKR